MGQPIPPDVVQVPGHFPVTVDRSRDALLTDFGKATLDNRYLLPGEHYQDLFARVASYYGADQGHAQRIYDYISRHWFMPATPILSNGGTSRGLPISCFLNEAEDSLEGIVGLWNENVWLASKGGGIGSYWGNLRSIGESIGRNGKTSGVIPFIRVMDSLTLAISQGSLRRGSAAVYLPIWHPEVEEFIEMRKPQGGDPNRKALNLHHGVLVTDAFMQAVEADEEWALRSPADDSIIRKVSARSLWIRILEARMAQGEPYIIYDDTVRRHRPEIYKELNHEVKTSNLCVHGDTRILTKEGYRPIQELAGTNQTLWNGHEWSLSRVEQTASMARMRRVEFSNSTTLWVTDDHKFYVQDSYHTRAREVRAADLRVGDKLEKWDFPVTEGSNSLSHPYEYTSGFLSADGTYASNHIPIIWLYGEKVALAPELSQDIGKIGNPDASGRVGIRYPIGALRPKFQVPHGADLKSRLAWLAGYLDGDGCVARNGATQTIQYSSTSIEFLQEIRLLLNSMGCDASIGLMHPDRSTYLPDGHGGQALFNCKAAFRSCVSAYDTQKLLDLGLKCRRLDIAKRHVQRDARRFVTVAANGTDFVEGPTFCANEPLRHRVMFEGIQTGNCAEIVLTTGKDYLGNKRTAVCCLSSLNLETWDEWKDDPQFIEDVMLFLDNVLQDFIDRAPDSMSQAKYAAMRERSVGLGVMGFHSLLQSRMIPFESYAAKSLNKKIFQHIRSQADNASYAIGQLRGPCPDAVAVGSPARFTHKMAIAPTASISIIAGCTSPGIEPISANVFLQKTLSGSFSVRNRHLKALLASKGRDTDEVWSNITLSKGSVQHLGFLTQDEKDVFKTAFELDQSWIIDMAADRAPDVDQAQSVNLFLLADVPKRILHQLHFQAWKKGLKSLYYCRSLSLQRADTVSDTLVGVAADNTPPVTNSSNGETCEACQ